MIGDDFIFRNDKKNETFSFVASFLSKFSLTTRLQNISGDEKKGIVFEADGTNKEKKASCKFRSKD